MTESTMSTSMPWIEVDKHKEILNKISLTWRRIYFFLKCILSSFENKCLLIIEHYREAVMDIVVFQGIMTVY